MKLRRTVEMTYFGNSTLEEVEGMGENSEETFSDAAAMRVRSHLSEEEQVSHLEGHHMIHKQ